MDVRGSIGSTTYQRTSSGAIARRKPNPSFRRFSAQLIQRASIQKLTRLFQDLSNEERLSWEEFGKAWSVSDQFGDSVNLIGLTWFVKFNSPLRLTGQTHIVVPPDCPNTDFNRSCNLSYLPGTPPLVNADFGARSALNWYAVFRISSGLPPSSNYIHTTGCDTTFFNTRTRPRMKIFEVNSHRPSGSLVIITWYGLDTFGRKTPDQRFNYIVP